jgi:hypothetical protein
MARALHGHNVCAEISPKPLSGLNFQIEDSEKFGLDRSAAAFGELRQGIKDIENVMSALGGERTPKN